MSDRIIAHLLKVEGWPAFTDNPRDRGGPTKGGITLQTLREWRHDPTLGVEALKALPQVEAEAIYRQRYIVGPRFDHIADELLRFQVVDAGVMSGPERATRWLQQAAGAVDDGKFGPQTLASVNGTSGHRLGIAFAVIRIRFLGELIARTGRSPDPRDDQDVWASGWLIRCTEFLNLESERA